jgi:hypothetical protein
MSHDDQVSTQNTPDAPLPAKSTAEGMATGAATASIPPQKGQAKSVSAAKLAANRRNAQRSTGPRTPKGKAHSSQNSRKHGFFARQPLPAGEEGDQLWEEYRELVDGIWEYYQPVGYMEGLLTEKIATESIRYSRLLDFESHYLSHRHAFYGQGVDHILRFQGALNRQLFQTMRELERLQANRKATQGSHPEDRPHDGVEPTVAPDPAEPDAPQSPGSSVAGAPTEGQMPAEAENEGVATLDAAAEGALRSTRDAG